MAVSESVMASGGPRRHQIARANAERYEYLRLRGHTDYQLRAKRNDELYLGGGLQWLPEDREILRESGRPAYEINATKIAVNSAAGYQINNRVDISFSPRGGDADDRTAEILSRVAMQVADSVNLHWKETEIFLDGLIQQRGYLDMRMAFDDNLRGNADIEVLDPLDVIPDCDAKSYDPKDWNDVTVTRWLTLDDIEDRYGRAARTELEAERSEHEGDEDYGEEEFDGVQRAKFGQNTLGMGGGSGVVDRANEGVRRFRIIDRQRWVMEPTMVAVTREGDILALDENDEDRVAELEEAGAVVTKRLKRRVKWTVSCQDVVLHDDISPYPFFTIVPYFPYFRRGQTRGMVDDAEGPQQIVNKALSQYIHIINSTANSGWIVQKGSLTNMTTDDLELHGSATGIVIEYKEGAEPPEKIQPNQVPPGIDRVIDHAFAALKEVTVPDAMRGTEGKQDDSGIAIQSRQFAAQQQLAVALDNLARTRHMVARRILWMIQHYYDEERVFRITEKHPRTGRENTFDLRANVFNPITGNIINDLTAGEYDVVINEKPMQVTFNNSQFEQAIAMRREGIRIPDAAIIKESMLTDKPEILEQMEQASEQDDPVTQAEVRYKLAQAAAQEANATKAQAEALYTRARTVSERVSSQYSAMQSGQIIAQLPQVSPLADQLLLSAGYVDQDQTPIVPDYAGQPARSVPGKYVVATDGQGMQGDANGDGIINGGDIAGVPENTNPETPTNPDRGMNAGIEGGDQ